MEYKIIIPLVAAISAAGGILITQAFTTLREYLAAKRTKRVLLRKKYEMLIDQVSESVAHRIKIVNYKNDDFFSESLNMPLEKVLNLSLLYFPELVQSVKNYRKAYHDFYVSLADTYIPDDVLTVAMQAASEATSEHDVTLKKLDDATKELYKCIQNNAARYTKA